MQQNQMYATTFTHAEPSTIIIQIGNAFALVGMIFDIAAAAFALFLLATFRAPGRLPAHYRIWAHIPFVFAFAGGTCFVVALLLSCWAFQPPGVCVALAVAIVVCITPVIAYAVSSAWSK